MDGTWQVSYMTEVDQEVFRGLCGAVFKDEFIFFASDAPPAKWRIDKVWKLDGVEIGFKKHHAFRPIFQLEFWYGFGTCTNYVDQARIKLLLSGNQFENSFMLLKLQKY